MLPCLQGKTHRDPIFEKKKKGPDHTFENKLDTDSTSFLPNKIHLYLFLST